MMKKKLLKGLQSLKAEKRRSQKSCPGHDNKIKKKKLLKGVGAEHLVLK